MAAPIDVRQRQRAVIEFLVLEGETANNIHRRLENVYKRESLAKSSVYRWVERVSQQKDLDLDLDNSGDYHPNAAADNPSNLTLSLSDKPRAGRPASSVNTVTQEMVEALIRTDRRISLDDIARTLDISHGSAHNLVKSLGFSKVCARWVPRQLTPDLKRQRLDCCTELLQLNERDDTFLRRIVTGDETWVHHYEPESKRQSMEWRHPSSPKTKKFKTQTSAGKVMATVFWDCRGVILVDFLPQGTTVNSEQYIQTLKNLKARIRRTRPDLEMERVLFHQDNARPHTSARTREAIASYGWTTLPHPSYSPDLAPSDFHLFGPLKESMRGQRFDDDDEVKRAVKAWLKDQPTQFYEAGIHALVKRWTVAIERGGDYVEK